MSIDQVCPVIRRADITKGAAAWQPYARRFVVVCRSWRESKMPGFCVNLSRIKEVFPGHDFRLEAHRSLPVYVPPIVDVFANLPMGAP